MKNKIFKTMLVVGLVLCGLVALAPQTQAQSFYSGKFLTGQDIKNISLTNYFGQTNVYVRYGSTYGPAYATTSNSVAGLGYTNGVPTAAQLMTNAAAIVDIGLWANRDGSPLTASISAHVFATNSLATNSMRLFFAAIPKGVGGTPASTAQNQFSFTVTTAGASDVIVATNLPTTFLQGCGAIRLLRIEPTTVFGSDTNYNVIRDVSLNGFRL